MIPDRRKQTLSLYRLSFVPGGMLRVAAEGGETQAEVGGLAEVKR